MNILVACEESQVVCKAFRARGHNAFSCDIIECSGGHPEWHIVQDVLPLLNGRCAFTTMDGTKHTILGRWDMIIAHPPCTRLCNSGQRWLYWGSEEYRANKKQEQEDAIEFFMQFVNADCEKIAIENPSGIMSTHYRKPDCTYNPYDFEGETECKKTCLWLKGLDPLKPTREVPLPKEERTQGIWKAHFGDRKLAWNDPETAKLRSVTPSGVAKAMAEQWGGVCEVQDGDYKLLYELADEALAMYQDEIVPNLRKKIAELERERVEVVRCKDCAWYRTEERICVNSHCTKSYYGCRVRENHFCSFGERKEKGDGET